MESGNLGGQQIKKAGCHLSGALLLINGIDLGSRVLTLLEASSSHLPSLFLGCFGPCGKSECSHSTSRPRCNEIGSVQDWVLHEGPGQAVSIFLC